MSIKRSIRAVCASSSTHLAAISSIARLTISIALRPSRSSITGNNDQALEFLLTGETPAGETRRFFLYFDTTANPKMAKDYHYYASETGADYLAGYRGGPDTEGLGKTTALKMDLFTTPGGDLSVIQNGRDKSGFYFHYPVYKQYGDSSTYRGFKAASYSASLTPLYLEAQATFTGYDAGSGPQTTGSGMLQTSHIFKDGQSYTILQGNVRMDIHADIPIRYIAPTLVALRSGAIIDAWYTNAADDVVPSPSTNAPLCHCPDALIMQTARNHTEVFQLNSLAYNSTAFDYSDLNVMHDSFKQYMRYGTSDSTWHTGDQIDYSFTYISTAQERNYAQMAPVLASLHASVPVTVGTPIAYSDNLFKAQLYYYEDQSWEHVISDLMEDGWGADWNISYMVDTQSGEKLPAHHQDSSMGAGFILYTASLKAAMTGEDRYYRVADAYANYFLQLEQRDIEQYGASASGRISYFFNASPDTEYFGVPPGSLKNETSYDQMMTSALGLWSYYHLDSQRIQYQSEVRNLLLRMGDYSSEDSLLDDDLHNIGVMLGDRENWFTRGEL